MQNEYAMQELVAALGGRLVNAPPELRISQVCTDTRKPMAGGLFVALIGERFDAHAFLDKAVAAGAVVLCVSDLEKAEQLAPGHCYWLVEDTKQAFIDLASWYRLSLKTKVIAVSGSVGKTSTRDMIFAALSSEKTAKTEANLNNEIGVAQTLFATDEDREYLVLELGIGAPGEMAVLTNMAKPDIAVITMIGHSHLEFFGTQEALAREKLEMLLALRPHGLLVLNADDAVLLEAARSPMLQTLLQEKAAELAFISLEDKALPPDLRHYPLLRGEALRFAEEESHFQAVWENAAAWGSRQSVLPEQAIELHSYGRHMVQNALFALVIAAYLGLAPHKTARNLLRYVSTGARQKRREGKQFTLIDDSYNASPEAMRAALSYLVGIAEATGRRSIAALGCVNELGDESVRLHRLIGRDIAAQAPDLAYLCGTWADDMAEACRSAQEAAGGKKTALFTFPDRASLSTALLPNLKPRDILLVKASHSYAMEILGEEAWKLMEEGV